MPKILPEGSKVVLEPDAYEKEYNGKIIIPEVVRDKHQHAQQMGTVVAVGPTADTLIEIDGEKRPVREGDRVMFIKHAFVKFQTDRHGKDLWIINDGDILGVEVE